MYLVCRGSLGVYAAYGTAEETLLTKLKEGDVVGEIAILNDEPRSATVVALEGGTEVDVITKSDFLDRCTREPEFAYRVMQYIHQKRFTVTVGETVNLF